MLREKFLSVEFTVMYKMLWKSKGFWYRHKKLKVRDSMYQESIILCGSSAYEQKYYFNEDFASLPERIQEELKIMCVLFTEDVGGVLTLEFGPEGNLELKVDVDEGDLLFDEIGSVLKIKQLQREKEDLFLSLEQYYKVFFLGEE